MAALMNTILIIGGTSGIGEGFARRLHAQGKKVIVAGRRQERLTALSKELAGLDTRKMDIANIQQLPAHATEILKAYPALDTVILSAGVQQSFSVFDPASATDSAVVDEITANLTAPVLLTRAFLPHLASLAAASKPANLLILSSATAYFPLGFYPVYCPTKAAIHSFCVTTRAQLGFAPADVQKHLSVCEVVPPYVDTGLDASHREAVVQMQGGPDKAFPPMPLAEYLDQVWKALDETEGGKLKKEVGVGFGEMGASTWRQSFGKVLEGMGINA